LTNHVEDIEIAALLAADDPEKACARLITLTLQRGASDNVSVVIVACDHDTQTTRFDSTASFVPDRGIGG
jgi:serine/threonine protein phosphatase PrpC